ncbi:unnamed protein product [Caenorhabditis angaria]|uniref:Uncharacterized protein n=1 Tax=Caenorhabditis angaria TaxID=860376 RepID=A0A9P1IB29_9PELO|nr:unnamed protein product [Caenorhabditis angaria]
MRFLLAALLILGTIEAARNCKNRYAEARGRDSTQVFQQRYGCKTESQIAEDYWTTVGFDGQLRDGRTTDDFLRFPGDQLNNAFIGYWITRSKYGHSRHYEAFGHVFVKSDGRICGWFVGLHHEVIEVCGGFRVLSRNRRNPQEPIPFEWVQGEQWRNRDVLGIPSPSNRQIRQSIIGRRKFQGISPNSEKFVEVNEPAEFSSKVWLLKKRSHQLPQQHQQRPQNVVQPSGEDADLQTYNDPHEQQRIAHIKSFPYYDQYGRPSGHHFDSERPAYDSYGRRIPFQTYDPVPSRGDPDYADWLRRQYELRASQNRARPDVQPGVGYGPASDSNSWAPGRSEGQAGRYYPSSEGQAGQSEDRDDVPEVRYGSDDGTSGRVEVQTGTYPGYQSEGQAGRSDSRYPGSEGQAGQSEDQRRVSKDQARNYDPRYRSEDRDGSSGRIEGQGGRSDPRYGSQVHPGRSGASEGQAGKSDPRYGSQVYPGASEGQAGSSDPRYGSQVHPGRSGASEGQAGAYPGSAGSSEGQAGRSDPRYGSQVYPERSGASEGQAGAYPGSAGSSEGQDGRSDPRYGSQVYPGFSEASEGQDGRSDPRYGSQVYPGRSGASEGQAGAYPGSAGSPDSRYPGSEGQPGRSDPRYGSQVYPGTSEGQDGSSDSRYPGSEGQAGRSDPRYGSQVYPGSSGASEGQAGSLDSRYPGSEGSSGASEGQAEPSDLRQGSYQYPQNQPGYYWPSGVRKPDSARPLPDQSAQNLVPKIEDDGEIFVPKNADDDDEKYRNVDVYGNPINSAGPVRLARVKPQIIVRDRAGRTYRPWTDPTTGKITYIYESKSGNDRNVELPDAILPDIERQLEAQRRRQYLENELRGEIRQGGETQRQRKDSSSAQNPRHRRH